MRLRFEAHQPISGDVGVSARRATTMSLVSVLGTSLLPVLSLPTPSVRPHAIPVLGFVENVGSSLAVGILLLPFPSVCNSYVLIAVVPTHPLGHLRQFCFSLADSQVRIS